MVFIILFTLANMGFLANSSEKKSALDPLLDDRSAKIFSGFQNEFKELHEAALAEEIKKNPDKKKELTEESKKTYEKQISVLKKAFAEGRIEIESRWPDPGISSTVPSGFGSGWGSVGVFAAFTPSDKVNNTKDGSMGLSLGLGDAQKYVSATVSVIAEGLYKAGKKQNTAVDYFKLDFDAGGVHLSISRNLPYDMAISYGRSHLLTWGLDKTTVQKFRVTNYLSLSKIYTLDPGYYWFSRFAGTVGVGDKGYKPANDYYNNKGLIYPFIGVNARVIPPLSTSLEYVSGELNFGANLAPFETTPIYLQATYSNLLKRDVYGRELYFSVAFSYDF